MKIYKTPNCYILKYNQVDRIKSGRLKVCDIIKNPQYTIALDNDDIFGTFIEDIITVDWGTTMTTNGEWVIQW